MVSNRDVFPAIGLYTKDDNVALVDCKKHMGKVINKGNINVHDRSDEWVPSDIIVWERGITLSHQPMEKEILISNKSGVNLAMEFSSPQEVGISMPNRENRHTRRTFVGVYVFLEGQYVVDGRIHK